MDSELEATGKEKASGEAGLQKVIKQRDAMETKVKLLEDTNGGLQAKVGELSKVVAQAEEA